MCNVEEKMSKAILKDGMTRLAQAKHPSLSVGLNKILANYNDNLKTTLR